MDWKMYAHYVCACILVMMAGVSGLNCVLKSSPTTQDLVAYRLCVRQELGLVKEGGRWGRSLPDEDEQSVLDKQTFGFSFCADLTPSMCRERIQEFEEWRRKNGIGRDHGRWGRSASNTAPQTTKDIINDYLNWRQRHGYGRKNGRWGRSVLNQMYKMKRADNADLAEVLKQYNEWREKNGYGQAVGRWGRSVPDPAPIQKRKRSTVPGSESADNDEGDEDEVSRVLEEYKNWRAKNGYGHAIGRAGR